MTSQLQTGSGATAEYNGMLDCFRKIIKQEGYDNCACDSIAPITNDMRQFLTTLSWYFRSHPHGGSQASYQVRCQR
jgi:hypothetical protein